MSLRSLWTQSNTEPCFGTGHSLSLICQPPSEDMKLYIIIICVSITLTVSRSGRGLSPFIIIIVAAIEQDLPSRETAQGVDTYRLRHRRSSLVVWGLMHSLRCRADITGDSAVPLVSMLLHVHRNHKDY